MPLSELESALLDACRAALEYIHERPPAHPDDLDVHRDMELVLMVAIARAEKDGK